MPAAADPGPSGTAIVARRRAASGAASRRASLPTSRQCPAASGRRALGMAKGGRWAPARSWCWARALGWPREPALVDKGVGTATDDDDAAAAAAGGQGSTPSALGRGGDSAVLAHGSAVRLRRWGMRAQQGVSDLRDHRAECAGEKRGGGGGAGGRGRRRGHQPLRPMPRTAGGLGAEAGEEAGRDDAAPRRAGRPRGDTAPPPNPPSPCPPLPPPRPSPPRLHHPPPSSPPLHPQLWRVPRLVSGGAQSVPDQAQAPLTTDKWMQPIRRATTKLPTSSGRT